MQNILNRHSANLIVISSICQKFLKTSLELYGWQFDMSSKNNHSILPSCNSYFVVYRQERLSRGKWTVSPPSS